MMDRLNLIRIIIENGEESSNSKKILINYPWDYEGPEIKLTRPHIQNMFHLYLNSKISEKELENWAEFIECREDIDYNDYSDLIFDLANPVINGVISKASIKSHLETLNQ